MAKNDFPKVKPAEAYPLGHAKENKDASAYTGFKFPKGGGNDIGVYKQPEVIKVDGKVHSSGNNLNGIRMSLGNVTTSYPPENPYGVKEMRGYGAAIKGRKISGKQG